MTGRSITLTILCATLLFGCSAGSPHSTLAGVYTAAQAAHGKDVYAGMCMTCHAGMGNHVGPVFRARWGGHDLQELYGYIGDNMPKNDPGSLSPDDDAAVVAYLLQLNDMPSGKSPLAPDTTVMKTIRIDTAATKH